MVGTWVFEDLIGDVSVEGLLERWSRVAGTIANVTMYHLTLMSRTICLPFDLPVEKPVN